MIGIRQTKRAYQVFSDKVGTLYQSHDKNAVKAWLWRHRGFLTEDLKCGGGFAKTSKYRLRYGVQEM